MNRDSRKKYGNRMKPGFPMLFETHRTMFFDSPAGGEQKPLGHSHDDTCAKCAGRCYWKPELAAK